MKKIMKINKHKKKTVMKEIQEDIDFNGEIDQWINCGHLKKQNQ